MSAILSDADLNDFISPGLACIKPAGEIRSNNNTTNNDSYEIQIGSNGEALEVSIDDGTIKDLPSASISLQDCLACSGCITSAEEVLLAKQTHTLLLDEINQFKNDKIFCLSISHQSRISLSTYLNIPIVKIDELLINLFSEKYGFKFIVGTEFGRILSITKTNNELINKKLQNNLNQVQLSSICPGFVLYVEKTKPELLPYLFNIKSPQQITGFILKTLISKQMSIQPDKIYHLSIMPCFDKKLEAARPEESDPLYQNQIDVDCVITPKELIELFKLENINLSEYITKTPEPPLSLYEKAAPKFWPSPVESWSSNLGSVSGGYSENYILSLQNYYQTQGIPTEIKTIQGKNSDVLEFQLINSSTGSKLGSSAIINGFRNIQNLVRKLKPSNKVKIGGKGNSLTARRKARLQQKSNPEVAVTKGEDISADPSTCDYVEVMACPGGCINGGGLNTPIDDGLNQTKEFLNKMIFKYFNELNKINELRDEKVLGGFMDIFKKEIGVNNERFWNYKLNHIEKSNDILTTGNSW
ncbi:hypothetical protein BN7_4109 [Wickerhamomyces ciferrii]|uniref:Cytosolic Fe-S cluster assembly factor NAR1 n=1 Tax=Wickerhamomyces ciferrii (strain ATCC 14091 / BCRC 22168 / CBS 111 / JCM 3599 / NBRC 0793 / NRRL Y-1031 F-60-10) TaxID=1206466 RepID=K0KTB5_WICCF|nr:uncharacterized protein BN7_4109 [Wickerhamomyces ciferrii]CCH44543.1 hypothetical protein BN7_4109 [Wickerhamomyces ciferrii]